MMPRVDVKFRMEITGNAHYVLLMNIAMHFWVKFRAFILNETDFGDKSSV